MFKFNYLTQNKKEKMKTKERTISTNNYLLPFLFIVYAIILEMVNFLYLGFRDSNGNIMVLPTYFLFDLAIIIMLAGLIYVVHNKIAMQVLFYLFLTFQLVLNVVNVTMYNIFGDILSIDLLKLGDEATSALTPDLIDWGGTFLHIGIFAVMVVATSFMVKFNKKVVTVKNFTVPVIVLAFFVMFQSVGFGLYGLQEDLLTDAAAGESEIENSDKYLWDNFQFKLDAYKKFGNYGFYTKSILNLIFKVQTTEEENEQYIDYIDAGYVAENPDAPLYGDNLIVILCESIDWFAIDPYNTPTLYSLATGNNSIVFTEFYGRNRTNNSEGIVLNGSMPRNIALSDAYLNGYTFDYALPKVFKATTDEETVATFVHFNTRDFYNRDITHIDGLGFDYMYMMEDYTGDQQYTGWGQWITDVDFTASLMDKIIPDSERFLTFISTMATHGPYTYDNPYYKQYYKTYLDNYEEFSVWYTENTPFIIPEDETDYSYFYRYKSAVIDLDRTVANLMQELELRGRAEDTSIVLFADHNAYYHDLSLKVKGIEKQDYQDTFAYNIPFIIYSPKLTNGQGEINSTFCNTYDILPTICDIYGLPSNTNLYLGYSVFSNEIKNSLFVSHLNGMFTNNIYSLNITDVYVMNDDVTTEEIDKFRQNANRFFDKWATLEILYENGINGTIDLNAEYV